MDGLRRSRLAVFGFFFLTGLALACWVVAIPSVEDAVHVSHATLGSLLLVLGLGSLLGMQFAGHLVDRFGSRRVTVVSAIWLVLSVNTPGLASNAWQLALALFAYGLGNGATDVAMNDQAVLVERRYGRPIMSSFHAMFSIGGAAGALVGALVAALHLPVHWSLGTAAVVGLVLTVVCARPLVDPAPKAAVAQTEPARSVPARTVIRRIVALAGLAFLLMLAEGTANDWSALQAVEHLDQSESAAALAYGSFAVAMTVGRFATDPIARRFGPVRIVRAGSAIAALGMLVVVVSPAYPLTLVGWFVFGLGLAGIVPQIFTAAGNLGLANQGAIMARVVGAGYLGLLAGPAVIGWLAHFDGITTALVLPLIFCIVGITLARQVVGSPQPDRLRREPATLEH